ncbi:MAG: hypothetical protein OXU78_06070 [Deltaproteobacteria bacterium]|nr:hypothetical protein [Deltaproteobacteria bacterium]
MELLRQIGTLLGQIDALWGGISALAAASLFIWRLVRKPRKHFPSNNEEFYRYYSAQIANAVREIWITSDGFNMVNPESRKYAEMMKSGFEKALSNGVIAHRFQILDTMHLNWIDELILLKEAHAENLKIFCNKTLHGIPNVCVMDPFHKKCVAERMEHSTGLLGQGSKPETYTFQHKDGQYAEKTLQIVKNAIEHPATRELDVEGLKELKRELLTERLSALKAWKSSPRNSGDIRESGVFDEYVIGQFIANENEEG